MQFKEKAEMALLQPVNNLGATSFSCEYFSVFCEREENRDRTNKGNNQA